MKAVIAAILTRDESLFEKWQLVSDAGPHWTRLFPEIPVLDLDGRFARVSPLCGQPVEVSPA